MTLVGLLDLVRRADAYGQLVDALARHGDGFAVVLPQAQPALLAALGEAWPGPLIVLVPRPDDAQRLAEEIALYSAPAAEVRLFPPPDHLPYERLTPDPVTLAQRLSVLHALARWAETGRKPMVIASVRAALQTTIEPGALRQGTRRLQVGARSTPDEELRHALALGYQRVSQVEVSGTVGRRGGIVDIFPPESERPLRIEFFGNRIDSLRWFDPVTQRSTALVDEASYGPAWELVPPPAASLSTLVEQLRLRGTPAEERVRRELEALLAGTPDPDALFYAPLFHQASLLDHCPPEGLIVLVEPEECARESHGLAEQADGDRRLLEASGELPPGYPRPYVSWEVVLSQEGRKGLWLRLASWAPDDALPVVEFPFVAAPRYHGRIGEAMRDIGHAVQDGTAVVLVSQQARRLERLLREHGHPAVLVERLPAVTGPGPYLLQGSLEGGWQWDPEGQQGLVILTDLELFGFLKQRRRLRRAPPRSVAMAAELEAGDYVVHVDHGIARFGGMVTRTEDGVERDYLLLEYAEGDKLYVPIEHADRVTRFIGAHDQPPTLTRLGTQEWVRIKERVRQSTREMAQELLALYASREVAQGIAFSPDGAWQEEMEGTFPYVETPDQAAAVEQVKRDMESPRPMDRLVCGDVGYGKTEIALRAAFKAVNDGYQVAVLVPTTVLAQQHYETFTQRLARFPVTVELLSRFRTDQEQRQVVEGLAQGTVDIVIGTHRLLSKDVRFKNLGLVIIDEEQRFGVAHKEHLKKLRKEVDVLTLTATPIPRTLQMALAGVRDMSTLETPPEGRLPIKTFVGPFDERLVRSAILRELERGGQVFFVHNRVHNIELVASRLRELVPEASFAIAHGRMPEEQLERVMFEFSQRRFDVLVCTTIIESGLDLPNVNTMIVNQADRLGLAQLYQLRGRIGRGEERAYAYLFYDRGKRLTDAAKKRLQTIFEAAELGAGFRIALRDLEIRGAGNLLGPEQSGHIQAVGFELYTRLLAEAVAQLRAEQEAGLPPSPEVAAKPSVPPVTVDLPLPARLPEEYVPELAQRMAFYHRLAAATTPEEVRDLAQEIRDRFGEPPEPAANLLFLAEVRALALQALVHAIVQEGQQLVVRVHEGVVLPRARLEQQLAGGIGEVRSNQVRLNLRVLRNAWKKFLLTLLRSLATAEALAPVR